MGPRTHGDQVEFDRAFADGKRAKRQKRLRDAITAFECAAALDPESVQVHIALGECYEEVRNTVRAAQAYRSAVDLYTRRGYFLKAVAMVKHALRCAPNDLDLYTKLALLYADLGLRADAALAYQRAAEFLRDDEPRACELFEKAIACDEQNYVHRLAYGSYLATRGRRGEALKVYRASYRCMLKPGEWLRISEHILALDPGDLEVAKGAAKGYLNTGRPKQAVQVIEYALHHASAKPVKLEDADSAALRLLYEARSALGDRVVAAAIAVFLEARGETVPVDAFTGVASVVEVDPPKDNAEGHRRLARVLADLHRRVGRGKLSPGDAALRIQAALDGNVVVRSAAPRTDARTETVGDDRGTGEADVLAAGEIPAHLRAAAQLIIERIERDDEAGTRHGVGDLITWCEREALESRPDHEPETRDPGWPWVEGTQRALEAIAAAAMSRAFDTRRRRNRRLAIARKSLEQRERIVTARDRKELGFASSSAQVAAIVDALLGRTTA